MSSAVYLWKTFRAQAEQDSGVSQKVFGFSPESVFAFIPECCSESARNAVRLHPGTLFGLPWNTHGSHMKILFEFTPCGLDATRSSMVSTERQIDRGF